MDVTEFGIDALGIDLPVVDDGSHERAMLLSVIDELDYGVMLLTSQGDLVVANDVARCHLAQASVFLLRNGRPVPAKPRDERRWLAMLMLTTRDGRSLDFFGSEPAVLTVAVAPVGYRARTGMVANVLVTFGKQTACQQISLTAFARSRGLTPTESRVLESLANGHTTQETAREHGIAISTIRTHIRQVLYKTGCTCLRDLLCQVSRLPPIRSKIRPLQRSADSHANL
jgi:DNA-binding CsgD family transcriptional regulator